MIRCTEQKVLKKTVAIGNLYPMKFVLYANGSKIFIYKNFLKGENI